MKMENDMVNSSELVFPRSTPIGVREGTGMDAVRVLRRARGQFSSS